MPILSPPNDPPQTEAGTLLYKIGREWCMGDTLKVFNNNFTNLDTRLDSVSTNLFAGLSSHVFKFNVVNTPTINLNYSTSLNRISADVIDGSINTAKLGGNILQAGKTLLTAANLSALQDVLITTPINGQLLQWNGTNWVNATVSLGGGGGGGTTTTGFLDPAYFNYTGSDQFTRGFDITVNPPNPVFQTTYQALTIKESAVNTSKIADNNVTPVKLSPGRPVWDINSNVAIGGSVPNNPSRLTVFGGISASGTILGNFNEIALSTRAGNLTGGTIGQIAYQSGANVTAFLPTGTAGQFLRSNGSSAPSWSDVVGLTVNAATSSVYSTRFELVAGNTGDMPWLENSDGSYFNRLIYQIDKSNTALLATPTSSQSTMFLGLVQQAAPFTNRWAPAWKSVELNFVPNIGTANITGATSINVVGRIPYVSGLNATSFTDQPVSENYVLRTNVLKIPTWVNQTDLTAGTARGLSFTTTAVRRNGVVHLTDDTGTIGVAYTADANRVLVSGGTTAPTWTLQSNLSVGSATNATTATKATNVIGERGLLYNSGTDTTKSDIGLTITPAGGDVLVSTGSLTAPAWKDPATTITAKEAKAPHADFTLGAGKITGTLAIANGGTGANTAAAARTAFGLATNDNVAFANITANGTINATGDITAFSASDIRLKENIKPLNAALEKVNKITGIEYDWTKEYIEAHGGENKYLLRKHDVGVIAQELQAVLPEVVAERENGYLAVKYEKIIPLLIEAIKELSQEVQELKSKIKE